MTYSPYFRGKQFELIAIRDAAKTLSGAGFVPIVEPVRADNASLSRAVEAISRAGGRICIVVNPGYGQLADTAHDVSNLVTFDSSDNILVGVISSRNTPLTLIRESIALNESFEIAMIHRGYPDPSRLATLRSQTPSWTSDIFIESDTGVLYRRHFPSAVSAGRKSQRVLIEDGFLKKRNREYEGISKFSELNVVFEEFNMDGFGDFLTVGDHYSEGGGPAYAVAIHLTFIDPENDNSLFVEHFVSDTNDTPTDPGGKFAQALDKLVVRLELTPGRFLETSAIREFRDLHTRRHYPGLGYIKKLSMIHHIETIADYESRKLL